VGCKAGCGCRPRRTSSEYSRLRAAVSRLAAENGTYRGGLAATREAKRHRAAKIAEEDARARRLSTHAGVPGPDDEGRWLDQREFDETKQALRWVATVQMGRYRGNKNRYVSDALNIIGDFDRYGLPEKHGVIVSVRPDGQAWFAYRRTITGWVLAIGSRDAPLDQWFYDGARAAVRLSRRRPRMGRYRLCGHRQLEIIEVTQLPTQLRQHPQHMLPYNWVRSGRLNSRSSGPVLAASSCSSTTPSTLSICTRTPLPTWKPHYG